MGTMIFIPFQALNLNMAPVTKRAQNSVSAAWMAKVKLPEGAPTIFLPNKAIMKKLIQKTMIFVAVVFFARDFIGSTQLLPPI
jgi:hypothetical protein